MTLIERYLASGLLALCLLPAHAQVLQVEAGWPQANGIVEAQRVDAANQVLYVAGSFTEVNGQPRVRLAAIDLLTGSLLPWAPAANATVNDIEIAGDSVIITGLFTQVNDQPRQYLAALDAATGALRAWSPTLNANGFCLLAEPDRLIVTGFFNTVNGSPRARLAAFDGSTGQLLPWNPGCDGNVRAIARYGDDLLLAGSFTTAGGASRSNLARINAATGAATGWQPSTNGLVQALHASGTTLLIGGQFTSVNGIARERLAAISLDDGALLPWAPAIGVNVSGTVRAINAIPGMVLAGGFYTQVNGSAHPNLACLNPETGALLPNTLSASSSVNSIVVHDDLLLLGGAFTLVQPGPSPARLAAYRFCYPATWYADADEDGFGNPAVSTNSCAPPPGYVANADDCDDTNPLVGLAPLWYADADGDGFGDPNASVQACAAPDGHVDNGFDCDDSDPDILTVYGLYPDADGDGFGDPEGYLESCTLLAGYVENDLDCDDTDPSVGDEYQPFYWDMDGDGYGDELFGWFCSAPEGCVGNDQDCDDNDPNLYIGAPCDDGDPLTHDAIDANCNCTSYSLFASIRVKLQGAYIGNGLHRTTLHQQGLMPIQEPYTALGYDPAPNSIAEGSTMAPQQVPHDQYHRWVDWVVVELREANDPSVPVTTRYGLLNETGLIIDPVTDGLIRFPVPPGFYHVAVLHRNHQGLVTQDPIDFTLDFVTYYPIVRLDLPSTPVIGGAAARFHDPVSGFAMMRCGDVTFNDDIRYVGNGNDRDPILVRIGGSVPTSTATGYYQEDVTLDGLVKYVGENNDRDPILQSIGGNVPTNVLPNFYLR
jgi:hypothetical protein